MVKTKPVVEAGGIKFCIKFADCDNCPKSEDAACKGTGISTEKILKHIENSCGYSDCPCGEKCACKIGYGW